MQDRKNSREIIIFTPSIGYYTLSKSGRAGGYGGGRKSEGKDGQTKVVF